LFHFPELSEAMMWSVAALEVSDEQRVELERRVRAHTSTQRAAKRARIVLMAADGVSSRQIAAAVGISEEYVAMWRRRFSESGVKGLDDQRRSGRPRVYGPEDRLRIVATATTITPEATSHWSHSQLAGALSEVVGISASQIGRILADLDIKPHLVRSWITRVDTPEFWAQAAEVCGLYLDPPERALLLSVDEKKNVPARTPTKPSTLPSPGRVAKRESEYERNGMLDTLFAAFDVASGEVIAAGDASSNSAVNFISFLERIDAMVAPGLDIHLVMDNGSSHTAKATAAWLETHARFHAHFTPPHASWLNQVEMWFSILSRRLLKRGEFASVDELISRIMAFIADYNSKAKPFRWTYDGSPLKVS
jgi:transposase